MSANILTAIIMYLVIAIVALVVINLLLPLDSRSFGVGFVLPLIFGFTWFRVNDWISSFAQRNQPLSITLPIKETSVRVVKSAIGTIIKLIFLLIGLAAILFVLLLLLHERDFIF